MLASFWKGRSFSSAGSRRASAFSAAGEKKLWLRNHARIHRSTIWTPGSTFAFSRGLTDGLGRTPNPRCAAIS